MSNSKSSGRAGNVRGSKSRKLTQRWCETAPEGEHRDSGIAGVDLRLWVGKRARTWYVLTGATRTRHRLGSLDELPLREARAAAAKVANRERDAWRSPASSVTVSQAFDRWRSAHLDILQRGRDTVNRWERYMLPAIGRRKLSALRRPELQELVLGVHRTGRGVTANRIAEELSTFLRWCVEQELVEQSPIPRGLRRPHKPTPKQRALSFAELKQWLPVLMATEHPAPRAHLLLVLLTGQRPGEVLAMQWDEVDFGAKSWTFVSGKTNRTRVVPLSTLACELLDALPRELPPFAFSPRVPYRLLRKTLHEAQVRPASPHDLRRTFATRLGELGVEPIVIELLLGHSLPGLLATYQTHGYAAEQRTAVDQLADRVRELMPAR